MQTLTKIAPYLPFIIFITSIGIQYFKQSLVILKTRTCGLNSLDIIGVLIQTIAVITVSAVVFGYIFLGIYGWQETFEPKNLGMLNIVKYCVQTLSLYFGWQLSFKYMQNLEGKSGTSSERLRKDMFIVIFNQVVGMCGSIAALFGATLILGILISLFFPQPY